MLVFIAWDTPSGTDVHFGEIVVKKDKKLTPSHNPFAEEGFKLSSLTHKCCCVAVRIGEMVEIRDTKNPQGPTLTFNKAEWDAFVKGVKNNEFDV